jgi:hypothetical protein
MHAVAASAKASLILLALLVVVRSSLAKSQILKGLEAKLFQHICGRLRAFRCLGDDDVEGGRSNEVKILKLHPIPPR